MSEDEGVDTDFGTDTALESLEEGPEAMDNPVGEGSETALEAVQDEDEPKRVLLGGKEDRESLTIYVNPERRYDIDDYVNELKREFKPKPRALDVYAAVMYAGMPDGSDDPRWYLREFGYHG